MGAAELVKRQPPPPPPPEVPVTVLQLLELAAVPEVQFEMLRVLLPLKLP